MSLLGVLKKDYGDFEVFECKIAKQTLTIQPDLSYQFQQIVEETQQELFNPLQQEDAIIDILINDKNYFDLNKVLMDEQNTSSFAQLVRILINALNILKKLEIAYSAKQEEEFVQLMTIFFEVLNDHLYSVRRRVSQSKVMYQVYIDYKDLILIFQFLTSTVSKLRCKEMLYRLFVFLLCDSEVFKITPSQQENFEYVAQMVAQLLERNYNNQAIQIIGYLYLAQQKQAEKSNTFKDLIRKIFAYLKSYLTVNQTEFSLSTAIQISKVLNLVFTGRMSVILYDIGLFQTIYHALRQLCIMFHPKPCWSSDRQFIQLLISLFKIQLGYLTSIETRPSDFFSDFSYLCDLITDDSLFLAQKQCDCFFVSDVLPSLFVTRGEIIQALCLHDHSQLSPALIKHQQQSQAQIQLFNSNILTLTESDSVEEIIRASINKKIKSKVKQWSFQRLMKYDMESPGFTYDQFVKSIDQKILNTMLILEVASEKGNLKIVLTTSDQFLIQTYKPQNNHSEGEQIINKGGKIVNQFYYLPTNQKQFKLSCRSNDDSQIFVFDQQSKMNIYSPLRKIVGGSKHHPNTKKLIEVVPSGLNVYIDDQKFISINFQDGNMNQICLELLDQRFGNDLLLLQGEFFVLEEAKDQNKSQQTKSMGYLEQIIPLGQDCHRQHLEDIFNEFTSSIYLQRVTISPISLDKIQGIELNAMGPNNIIQHVSVKSKDIKYKDGQFQQASIPYPISVQLAYRQMIQELVYMLSLACNAASRPNVQIFLLDLHILLQQPGWAVNALIQLDGRFVFHLIKMSVLQIEEGSANIFHSAMQAAYAALAQQDALGQEILHTLWQQLLNRTQQYYNVELVLKLTKAQQEKKAKQLQEESKKQQKNQKKELKSIPTSSKPKGIGYGDIGNKQMNQQNIQQQQQSSQTKVDLSAFENELVYGSMAEQYRNEIIHVLMKSTSSLLKQFTKAPTISLHQEIAYSKLPSIIYSLLKSNSLSEILNKEKLPIFDTILNILDSFGSCMEYGDIIVDRDYGGSNSEQSIFSLLKKINDESEFCGSNFTQENVDDDDAKKKFQIRKSAFLKKLQKITNSLEKNLQASEFLIITHQESNEGAQNGNDINMSQFYNSLMKSMILGQCSILEQAGYQAQMGQYANNTGVQNKSKLDRIIMELGTMPSSLPCESTNSIFLRYDKVRMDVMRTVIFGSSGTPYAHGAFLYNLHFGDDYPQRPPKCLLETTGHGKVRFNPNLYNCGKVCLSLLGTWGDNWIPNVSTLLQILISIQSMVMSEYVYFNEPGWEHSMGTSEGDKRNRGYCNIVKLANIRYAMIEQIREPPVGFEDVIKKSFYLRRDLILKEVRGWIDEADLDTDYSGSQNHTISQPFQQDSTKYKIVLKAEINELEKEFEKLKLKIHGTLNFGSSTTKKIITHNYGKKSNLYLQEERLNAINDKKNQVKLLLNKPLDDVDVSWEKSHATKKEFNVDSHEVQSLMSRYIGVMGIDSVMKQSQASILIYGLSAVGVEVAKNLVLSGIRRVTLMDKEKDYYNQDGQYYMNDTHNRLQQNYHKISHLNPFVQVDCLKIDKNNTNNNNIINVSQYNVVIVCEYDDYEELFNIASQCRQAHTALIIGEVRSVYGRIILDFDEQFTVHDRDGEVPIEIHIDQITDEGVIILPKGQKHTFQDGDIVMLREIVSEHDEQLSDMNGKCFTVKSINRSLFSIGNISGYRKFIRNGIAVQVKQKSSLSFRNIEEQVSVSNVKWDGTMSTIFTDDELIKRDIVNVLFEHYNRWVFINKHIPSTLEQRIDLFVKIANSELLQQLQEKHLQFKYQIYLEQALQFCLTCNGMIHAQAAFIAGIAAQETLKAITHKYTPINQAYVHDCSELCVYQQNDLIKFIDTPNKSIHWDLLNQHVLNNNPSSGENRYQLQQEVLGPNTIQKLQNSNLFMVGSGAIGCELLKNFAMLGIGSQGNGRIVVTDPDMIEHSNLSRQFLFREKHIRKPKSHTAANSIISMNPDMQGHVVALLDKVCPATNNIFNDYFYQQMNLVANALDNVEARLYIDSKCVQNSIPLIESGTLGPKGHVQVILPNLTESYGSKRDPEESNEIPYCTLKMFPEDTLHCLEWARDKFENMFTNKPQIVHKVLTNLNNSSTLQVIQLETTLRILKKKPKNFLDCLKYARNKYQKFFYNGIMQLLKAYPLDHSDEKGKLFWSSPKRPPFPNNFDSQDKMKLKFVISASILWAEVNMIPIELELLNDESKLIQILEKVEVDDFFIDETKLQLIQQQVEKNGQEQQLQQQQQQQQQQGLEQATPNELLLEILSFLGEYFNFKEDPDNLDITLKKPLDDRILLKPIPFEKDDDQNRHIDFIQAATNCRAGNYKLEQMEWLQVKLKAGRIVPAMATTTACISALQTIETIKVLKKEQILSSYKNTFLNLAIPYTMQSEPGECEKIKIRQLETNLWTRWNFQLTSKNWTIQSFIQDIEQKYDLKVIGIQQGAKPIYLPLMFTGKNEEEKNQFFQKPIKSMIELQETDEYVEIDVSFEIDGIEVKQPPKIRIHL